MIEVLSVLFGFALDYRICITGNEGSSCYQATEMTGWWLCADKPPSPKNALRDGFDREGRFIAFDSNVARCGPLGCPRLNGRFERITMREAGDYFRAIIAVDEEITDGFEPMDEFATSSCSFTRFILLGEGNAALDGTVGVGLGLQVLGVSGRPGL